MSKRHTTAALIAGMALTGVLGVTAFTHNAQATRSVGMDMGQIGSIDVFALVDRALSTDDMVTARQNYENQTNAGLEQLQAQFMQVQNQLSTMSADDPNAQTMYNQYQQLQQQMQMQSQQASAGYQTLIAKQIATAYEAIYAAANEVGMEQGYAFVFATRSDGELLQTETITGITQEILARPLMTPPSATDLTELVRVKLGYPEKAIEAEPMLDGGEATDAEPATTETQGEEPEAEGGEE